jgi:hypothetical protein
MADPGPEWRPRISPAVEWVSIDGDVIAVNGDDHVHVLRGSGAVVWPLLDGSTSLCEIADDVHAVFGVDPAQALHDLVTFAGEAARLGLVEDAQ